VCWGAGGRQRGERKRRGRGREMRAGARRERRCRLQARWGEKTGREVGRGGRGLTRARARAGESGRGRRRVRGDDAPCHRPPRPPRDAIAANDAPRGCALWDQTARMDPTRASGRMSAGVARGRWAAGRAHDDDEGVGRSKHDRTELRRHAPRAALAPGHVRARARPVDIDD